MHVQYLPFLFNSMSVEGTQPLHKVLGDLGFSYSAMSLLIHLTQTKPKLSFKKAKPANASHGGSGTFRGFSFPTVSLNFDILRALDCFNLFAVFMPSGRNALPYSESYHVL